MFFFILKLWFVRGFTTLFPRGNAKKKVSCLASSYTVCLFVEMDIEFFDRPLQVSVYLMWWLAYSGGTSEGYGASKAANDSPGAERRSGALHFLGHRQEYSHLAPQVCSFCTQPHSSSPMHACHPPLRLFFPQILWCICSSSNHPEEERAKFGYRSDRGGGK